MKKQRKNGKITYGALASELEDSIGVPEDVVESIIETEGLTAKLGAVALFSHVKDEDDE